MTANAVAGVLRPRLGVRCPIAECDGQDVGRDPRHVAEVRLNRGTLSRTPASREQ
jgi:hypothetical protein